MKILEFDSSDSHYICKYKLTISECAKKYKNWNLCDLAKEVGMHKQSLYLAQKTNSIPLHALVRISVVLNCLITDLIDGEITRKVIKKYECR